MQVEPPDTVPIPSSSPPLSPPFHQQTALTQNEVRLRRTAAAPPAAAPTTAAASAPASAPPAPQIKLHLWMPYGDLVPSSATRAGWNVPAAMTVREVKSAIASGAAGYGRWEPDGLRLIWRGRLLKDDEVLETVFSGVEEPTLHVVARPLPGTLPLGNQPVAATPSLPSTSATLHADDLPTIPQITSSPSLHSVALTDTVHYLIFVCREHMCAIMGREPLAWEDMYPAPTLSRAEAYQGILSVVRGYAGDAWATALQGDGDRKALEGAWLAMGSEAMITEVGTLWDNLVGRPYGPTGDVAQIELDLQTYTLHLPPLTDMVPAQLTHLLFYLRTAALVRYLSGCLAQQEVIPSAVPTTTTTPTTTDANNAPQRPQVMHQGSIRIRVPRLRISFALLQHLFWSAMRIVTILWMLTRSMPWKDIRLWILTGASLLWWAVDGFNHWIVEDRMRREARMRRLMHAEHQAAVAAAAGGARQAPPAGGDDAAAFPLDLAAQAAVDAPLHAAAAARAEAGAIRPRHARPRHAFGRRPPTGAELLLQVPYFHLEEDANQLRIRSRRFHGPGLPAPARHVNAEQTEERTPSAPELLPEPRTSPSRLITNALLPAALWFLTLIPAFEAMRGREIRQRERSMRAVIASMNPSLAAAAHAAEGDNTAEAAPEGEPAHAPAATQLVFPAGLSDAARKYYERVAMTTEAIDWEEERAAQRAMGIPDEDEGAAAGAAFMGLL